MKNQTILSVIIVSYNTSDLTVQALRSTWRDIASSSLLTNSTEVIVIDNHSTDDSVRAITKAIKTTSIPTRLIKNKTNDGFAKANNQAIALATGTYVLLLNSDTYVQPGALTTLMTSFIDDEQNGPDDQNRRLGILAASLLNADGTLQPQGGDVPTLLSLWWQMSMLDDLPVIGQLLPSLQHTGRRANRRIQPTSFATEPVEQGWVGGTAMMLSAQFVAEVGALDEQIFMYAEDMELCVRAHNHHWRVAIHPSARVTHFAHQSSSSATAIRGEFAGIMYLWSKHKPLWQLSLVKFLLQWGALMRSLVHVLLTRNQEKAKVYIKIFNDIGAS